jgi:outer membrane protein, heavy metal efflux system
MQVQTVADKACQSSRARPTRWAAMWVLALAAGGCATYAPHPLDVRGRFDAWQKQARLTNPDLAKIGDGIIAVDQDQAPVDVHEPWDVERLARVAVRFHPDTRLAATHIWTVQAGQITAGERPNPSMAFSPTLATNAGAETPWVIGWSFDIPIETAGKRGLRLAVARGQTDVALVEYAQASWEARSRVREALADYLLTEQEVGLDQRVVDVRQKYVGVLEARLKGGEASRPEVTTARVDLLAARGEMLAAQGHLQDARTKLAAAVGMPVAGLDDAKFEWRDLTVFPPLTPQQRQYWQTEGLLNRLDLRAALKEYATAESAVQLEVARQYPDIHLGPGYEFDQGLHKWTLGVSVDLPIFNQNQGGVAEAYARREEQGNKVLGLQIKALAALESAEAQYDAALKEHQDLAAQADEAQILLDTANKALAAGQEDRLAVTGSEVQVEVARRQQFAAVRRAREAAGAIEDAIQRPLQAAGTTTNESQATKGAAL